MFNGRRRWLLYGTAGLLLTLFVIPAALTSSGLVPIITTMLAFGVAITAGVLLTGGDGVSNRNNARKERWDKLSTELSDVNILIIQNDNVIDSFPNLQEAHLASLDAASEAKLALDTNDLDLTARHVSTAKRIAASVAEGIASRGKPPVPHLRVVPDLPPDPPRPPVAPAQPANRAADTPPPTIDYRRHTAKVKAAKPTVRIKRPDGSSQIIDRDTYRPIPDRRRSHQHYHAGGPIGGINFPQGYYAEPFWDWLHQPSNKINYIKPPRKH